MFRILSLQRFRILVRYTLEKLHIKTYKEITSVRGRNLFVNIEGRLLRIGMYPLARQIDGYVAMQQGVSPSLSSGTNKSLSEYR